MTTARIPAATWRFLLILSLSWAACGQSGTPLDADTRQKIDSISVVQIRTARAEMDSLCGIERRVALPRLVDSIKQKRLNEIRNQLKSVPGYPR